VVHFIGVGGFYTRCKAFCTTGHKGVIQVNEGSEECHGFTGDISDDAKKVDCKSCLSNMPKRELAKRI
jgi:hypothetical protein